jgi:Bap31/Bap29 cytoplasmic coiled-coil domain
MPYVSKSADICNVLATDWRQGSGALCMQSGGCTILVKCPAGGAEPGKGLTQWHSEGCTSFRDCTSFLQVVRSQAKGLETEYDRLLSEHDELQRRLRRTDPTYGGGGRSNKSD